MNLFVRFHSAIDNDAFNFVTGYVITDLTGDEIVDASDAALVDNNASNFVTKILRKISCVIIY